MRSGCAHLGAGESRGSRENGSAGCFEAGAELSGRRATITPVWVPDAAHEALRDLVRAREAAKKDELRARHRSRGLEVA